MNKINLKSKELELSIDGMNFDINIDVDDFCYLFAALQAKTLPAPDSLGTWFLITPTSLIKTRRIIKADGNDDLLMQLGGNLHPPTAGRWVKLMD